MKVTDFIERSNLYNCQPLKQAHTTNNTSATSLFLYLDAEKKDLGLPSV